MNEVFGPANGTGALQEELLKALIGKVVDQGTSMKESAELTRKVLERMEGMKGLQERMDGQEKRVGELIEKQQAVFEEVKQVAGKIDLPAEKIERLEQALGDHQRLFEKPLNKTVRYRHYVGWPLVVIFALMLIASGAVAFGIKQWQFFDGYKAAELKWRYVRLSTDSVVSRVADRAEQRSLDEPGAFAQDVQQEEKRRAALTRSIIEEREAHKNIEDLKRRPGLR